MALMKAPKFDSYDLSTLFGVLCGAAPCSVDLIKAFENRFPKIAAPRGFGVPDSVKPSCRVTQGYGLTEASPATHVMNLREGIEHQGSIGRIMPTMQARLVDVVSGMDVPRGEPGELWVRGPSVMKGYWKNTEATKDAFAEGGWLKSGDLATVDEDGYF